MSRNFCVKHICSQIRHGPRKWPPKSQKIAKFHKILFWAGTEGPRGSDMECKSDRHEISCGILVLKLLVWSFLTFFILKPVALARVKHRALYFLRVGPAEAFIVMKRGSHISVRISQTNFSCFTDPPKMPPKSGGLWSEKGLSDTPFWSESIFVIFLWSEKKLCDN